METTRRLPTNLSLPNSGPKSVRPAEEMAQKPSRSNGMNKRPDMQQKSPPTRPADPTMASPKVSSGDGLGRMTEGMGGNRRERSRTGMPGPHIPGSI